MLKRCSLMCVLFLLLEMINDLDARPQLMKPPLAVDDEDHSKTKVSDNAKIAVTAEPVKFQVANKTKFRILTHPIDRGTFQEVSDQEIIFPDDSYETEYEPVPRIDGPPKCADGSTYCENFDNYPYHHLRDVLKKGQVSKDLFGKDEVPNEIANRIGEIEDTFVCKSIDKTVYPKVGKNKNNKWKLIINQGDEEDGFIQGVRIETCQRGGAPCDIFGELPNGYMTSCKQKYVYRRLISLTNKLQPVPDTFLLPSACCCSYKRDVEFLARFGSPVTPAGRR